MCYNKIEFKIKYIFSTILKRVREKQGLSQNQLAIKADLTSSSISQFENNLREPSLVSLKKLSRTLGVSIDYLVGNESVDKKEKELTTKQKLEGIAQELIYIAKKKV